MKFFKILERLAVVAMLVLLSSKFGAAKTKQGDKLFKLGERAEAKKDYDHALDYFDQALATDPADPGYIMADQRIHSKAAEWHIQQGKVLRNQQKLNDALVEFQKAMLASPASEVAIQEIRSTTQMVKDQQRAAPGTTILTPAQRARQEMDARLNSLEGPPQLRPINQLIRSLRINNQPPHVLYESVGKLAAINVLFDPQGIDVMPGSHFNLDLNNVTLEEALNYISLETHTFWKPISRNAIFVTQESEPKRQEYQDEIVKVFYVKNSSTPAEFTEIFNAVRIGSKLNQGIFQVASQYAIVARGTPDAIALVEKLVHDLDRPKSEVVVDVVIMEVNKSKTSTIGASLLGQGGLSVPLTFNPRNPVTVSSGSSSSSTTTTGTGTSTSTTGTTTGTSTGTTSTSSGTTGSSYFTVANAGHLSSADFATSLPSTLLQALMSDTSSRILQRPQLRCTDGNKASLKIGEKIPYASGSLSSAVTTGSTIPYATTQFQQLDVGVNIDLEPHVNGPEDVSMHIRVEISNQNGYSDIAGVDEPIITQRINETYIRMKDGEIGLLGGLSDKEDNNTLSGFPGLTNIPVLGYLFGTKTKTKSDDEILIALIPHVVRAPDVSDGGDSGVFAGSERVVRVMRKSDGTLEPIDGNGQPSVALPVNVPFAAPAPPYTTSPPPAPTPPNQHQPPQQQ